MNGKELLSNFRVITVPVYAGPKQRPVYAQEAKGLISDIMAWL